MWENIDIIEELKSLKQLVRKLTKENKTLKEQLAKYEAPKTVEIVLCLLLKTKTVPKK